MKFFENATPVFGAARASAKASVAEARNASTNGLVNTCRVWISPESALR
jgi:hypothetical protein